MEREITRSGNAASRQGGDPAFMIKNVWNIILRNWFWFVLSLAIAMIIAWFYVQSKQPVYSRSASIMIRSNVDEADKTLKRLGLTETPTNLVNEILLMNTAVIAEEVVRRLDLDVEYTADGPFYDRVIYGRELPLNVRFFDLGDREKASVDVNLKADGSVLLSNLQRGDTHFRDKTLQLRLGDTLQSPLGRLAVIPSPYYKPESTCQLHVFRRNMPGSSWLVRSRTRAELRDPNSTVIDIRYRDLSPYRADDVLSTMVTVYNEQWMMERNRKIVSTNEFIRERLAAIEQELGSVEQDISNYKSENLIIDANAAGAQALAQANDIDEQNSLLESRIRQVRSIYDYMISSPDHTQQIPFNTGLNNAAIIQRISEYNSLVLQRNNHLAYSSAQNPLVVDLNNQLIALHATIVEALSSELTMLRSQQKTLQSTRSQAVSRVATAPRQEKYLLSVERQQKVKESLYLFLLQTREENELSQAFTAYNTQLVEPPHGSWTPIEPVPRTIYMMALVLGLAIPAVLIFLRELFKTTVYGRDDLKHMAVPFAGEIPLASSDKKKGLRFLKKKKAKGKPEVLVVEKSRNMMNEAFRVVRSNLEFLLGFDATHKVVMLTSLTPNSGKTFISANLSAVVGLKDKKVLAIDLDLRKGSLSQYVDRPSSGVSSFLSGRRDDWQSLLVPLGKVDVLPSGALPPNPTELLYTPRFSQLMEQARAAYDYVFIDCPPVEMVADAAIINRYVDLTLFVIRARMLEKSFLPEIDQWYADKKYTNLAVLLNGTDAASDHYGYHKYGYHRYGYHYYSYDYNSK